MTTDNERPNEFAGWLCQQRTRLGLTKTRLAELSEVAGPLLVQIENGKRRATRNSVHKITWGLCQAEGKTKIDHKLLADGLNAAGFTAPQNEDLPKQLLEFVAIYEEGDPYQQKAILDAAEWGIETAKNVQQTMQEQREKRQASQFAFRAVKSGKKAGKCYFGTRHELRPT